MTTTDLIYEALRNFRKNLMDDVRLVVREEIRAEHARQGNIEERADNDTGP